MNEMSTRRKTKLKVSLDPVVAAKVKRELYDPNTQKPRYGGVSALIEDLLRDWLNLSREERRRIERDPIGLPAPTGAADSGHEPGGRTGHRPTIPTPG